MDFSDLAAKLKEPSAARGLLKSALGHSNMSMIVTDPRQHDNPIIAVNKAFEAMTGYAEAEIVGKNCRFLQGEDTNRAEVARLRDCLKNEGTGYFELLNYRRDGSTFWSALHIGPVYDADGRLLYFFGSQSDVSERVEAIRQVQSEVRLTNALLQDKIAEVRRLHEAVDQANDAMMLTEYGPLDSPGPKIVWVNRGFEKMTGYSQDEVFGRTPTMLQGSGTDRDVLDAVRAALEFGEDISGQRTVNYRRDGSRYHVEWSISAVKDDDGQPTHWLSVQRDVTDEVEAEHKDLMAAELEHRHKNVFSLVLAVVNLMPEDDRTVGDFKEQLADKFYALVAAHDLVFQSEEEEIDVAEIAKAVLAPFPQAQLDLSIADVRIGGRPALDLALALHEMGTNAAKHGAWSTEAGLVSLSCWEQGDTKKPAIWFDWTESSGPRVSPPTRKGFGSTMLTALLNSDHRPDAGIQYDPDGVVCRGGVDKD